MNLKEQGFTPEQAIKYTILKDASEYEEEPFPLYLITFDNIDKYYQTLLVDQNIHWDCEEECCTFTIFTFKPDFSTLHFNQIASDIQT